MQLKLPKHLRDVSVQNCFFLASSLCLTEDETPCLPSMWQGGAVRFVLHPLFLLPVGPVTVHPDTVRWESCSHVEGTSQLSSRRKPP